MTTSTERMRELRKRKKAEGFIEVTVWSQPEHAEAIRLHAKQINNEDKGETNEDNKAE